jgi:hypothetical protein
MRDSCFEGVAHFAQAGTKLVVHNEGKIPHSFTAVNGSFDTGLLDQGETAEISLPEAGLVRVYCVLHGTAQGHGMAGVLVIGNPAPEAVGTTNLTEGLRKDLTEHDQALRGDIQAQTKSLEEIEAQVVAVRQALEAAGTGARSDLIRDNAVGIIGVLLGGAALAVVLRRWRPVGPSEERAPAPPSTSPQETG